MIHDSYTDDALIEQIRLRKEAERVLNLLKDHNEYTLALSYINLEIYALHSMALQIREVGEWLITANQHGAAALLFDLAWRIGKLEHTLDEVVRDAQEDARLSGGAKC